MSVLLVVGVFMKMDQHVKADRKSLKRPFRITDLFQVFMHRCRAFQVSRLSLGTREVRGVQARRAVRVYGGGGGGWDRWGSRLGCAPHAASTPIGSAGGAVPFSARARQKSPCHGDFHFGSLHAFHA